MRSCIGPASSRDAALVVGGIAATLLAELTRPGDASAQGVAGAPNIIVILADDLG